jgi:homoserine dehydrogenase
VEDEFNGVVIKGLFYDKQFMFGRGAGGHPTGSAVLSDITACGYNYRYEYKKRNDSVLPRYSCDHTFRIYFRYKTEEQRNLLTFTKIREQYTSEDYNYIVGDVNIANIKAHQEELRVADCFVAAYPLD